MYTQSLDHKVVAEINDDKPVVKIGVRFKDIFSEEKYYLSTDYSKTDYSEKAVSFTLFKENEVIGRFVMKNNDASTLLSEAFNTVQDLDFSKHFSKNKSIIAEEVEHFFKYYNDLVLSTYATVEGEKKRMCEIAGIKSKHALL